MSGQRGLQYVQGLAQTRHCTCPAPRAFHDDEGRCNRCGYEAERVQHASTRRIAAVLAGVLLAETRK